MKKIILSMITAMAIVVSSCKRSEEVAPSSPTTTPDGPELVTDGVTPVLVAGFKDHAGYTNATGSSAKFNQPYGIFVSTDGTLRVADSKNGAVRKIANGVVSTVVKNSSLVGISHLAATNDGTIAMNNGPIILFKSGHLTYLDDPGFYCAHCSFEGLSKSADGTYFWYNENLSDGESEVILNALKPNGSGHSGGGIIVDSYGDFVGGTAVSTTLNDNKFITLDHTIYERTHGGSVQHILPNTTFDGLTDIAVNKDGTKLYLADNGAIKLITRCSTCQTLLTVLVANADATGLALSNSEKVLFFTSSKHHTINKINL